MGIDTWSFTLIKEHVLRVFEKKLLKEIFAPKKGEVTGWRNVHK
jgi:hypothetical protein